VKKKLSLLLGNSRFQFLCQVVLGGIFIYASIGKIIDPKGFMIIISNYKLLPNFLVKLTAIGLPWIELILGIFLFANIYPKKTASVLSTLLIIFMLVLVINIIRGIDSNCGCFSTNPDASHSSLWLTIVRDIFFISLGIIIIFFGKNKLLEKA
jgi:hypothetical protein